jgi:hypothetical protein
MPGIASSAPAVPAGPGLLDRLVASTGADEVMVTTSTFAHADRLTSYELLAQAAQAAGPGEQRAPLEAHPAVVPE